MDTFKVRPFNILCISLLPLGGHIRLYTTHIEIASELQKANRADVLSMLTLYLNVYGLFISKKNTYAYIA